MDYKKVYVLFYKKRNKGANLKGGSMRFEIEHKYDTEIILTY